MAKAKALGAASKANHAAPVVGDLIEIVKMDGTSSTK